MKNSIVKKAIFAGSFDPITNGHLDIIKRASKLYDVLHVGVLINPDKKGMFEISERVTFIKECTKELHNVEVISFSGLLIDYCRENDINVLVRAIRDSSDVDYELQLAHMNKALDSDVETMIMVTNPKYSFVSSSMMKSVANFGGDISEFVPDVVLKELAEKMNR